MFINNPTATMVARRKVKDMNMMGKVWGRRIVSLLGKKRMAEYPFVRFLMRSIITHVMMKNRTPKTEEQNILAIVKCIFTYVLS